MGWRPAPDADYSFHSFPVVHEMAKDFISGLAGAGGIERGNPESFLGIYSQNRVEWLVGALGCWMMSNAIVPLYDTLGPAASSFIINQAKTALVIVDTAKKVKSRIYPVILFWRNRATCFRHCSLLFIK